MAKAKKITDPTDEQKSRIADLEALRSNLTAKRDQTFADDLVNGEYGFHKRGNLTEKQWFYADILLAKALGVAPPKTTIPTILLDVKGLFKFFDDCSLKTPKLSFTLEVPGTEQYDGEDTFDIEIRVTLAGSKAKQPGTLNLTDFGSYPNNKWYGRVQRDGHWEIAKGVSLDAQKVIGAFLTQLSHDPKGLTMTYGTSTGICCFCHAELTDPQSKGAGFGPVCAKNYGLQNEYIYATPTD